jgi:hypothetical protein
MVCVLAACRLIWLTRQAHSATKLRHDRMDANDARFLANIARTGFYRIHRGNAIR